MKCAQCHKDNPDSTKFCGECGSQLIPANSGQSSHTRTLETPENELTRGALFAGRYEIIEELGEGGMGRVYRVADKKVREEVALKIVRPEISSDRETIDRFRNELKTARKIRHKNVTGMYDLGDDNGTYYITMEYVPGENLKSLIKRVGQIPVRKALSTAKQICAGLAEAHRLGIIHRDLKPSNIMIDRAGNVRIMDFGIARTLRGEGTTGAGVIVGTPDYMSPEQVEGKGVDQTSDIYSLGVVFFEMLTGKVPFTGDTALSIALKHKNEPPPDPREVNPQVPRDFSRIVLRCLEKDKSDRFRDVEDLLASLNQVGEHSKGVVGKPEWENSIAVLPFADLSPQKDQEYFCDGMSEELINSLTRIKNLKVVARTSAFSFKGKEADVRSIGKQLNVNTVLEGSIRKAGNRLRITAQLINVSDGYHLWSEKYDRELDDVFAVQDEVALAIIDKLKLTLLGDEKDLLTKHHTEDLGAYDLYTKGRFFWNWRTEEGLKKAIKHFEQAIEKDPRYALAYVGLSDSYIVLPEYISASPLEVYPKAMAAATKALELDVSLGEAHASLASNRMFSDFDWTGAAEEFEKAIELNPNYATAYYWYGICVFCNARFHEAIDLVKRAQELDPVSLIMQSGLSWMYCVAGQYDIAIKSHLKMTQMKPEFGLQNWTLGLAHYHKNMYSEAFEEFKKEIEAQTAFAPLAESWLELTAQKLGREGGARKARSDYIEKAAESYVSHYYLAGLSLAIGEIDEAFEWLDKAFDHRDFWLLFIKVDPLFENVRSDPRFNELLKKMNLDPY